jgi:hypothetical protein
MHDGVDITWQVSLVVPAYQLSGNRDTECLGNLTF